MKLTPLNKLITELTKLPGIGEKTATRLAFFLVRADSGYPKSLANAILELKEKIRFCSYCFNLTESDPCQFCLDSSRRAEFICVVEEPADLLAVENSHGFKGRYHVLQGVLSPLDGIGPEEIKIKELIERIKKDKIKEVIIALNPSVEGEATTLYLSKLIKPLGVKISRIAYGIPLGGDLEYLDGLTIGKALENRVEI